MAPRLTPLPREDWGDDVTEARMAIRPPQPRHPFPITEGRPQGTNVNGTMARHPELMRAYYAFNGHVLFASRLDPRERELVILRVAALRNSAYERAQHRILGADAGLSGEELDRVDIGPAAPGWSVLDRALLQAVDDLIADAKISDGVWATLADELDDKQLMDLVFTVGAYETLAMAINSFAVELDVDLAAWQ